MRAKGKRLWEAGRHVQVDICDDDDVGFVVTIGPVSFWLKKEEAQDMVATLTRALMRSAAIQAEEKPDLSPTAIAAALQACVRLTPVIATDAEHPEIPAHLSIFRGISSPLV